MNFLLGSLFPVNLPYIFPLGEFYGPEEDRKPTQIYIDKYHHKLSYLPFVLLKYVSLS